MRLMSLAVALLFGSLLGAHGAAAATVTKLITFTATDFSGSNPGAAPVGTVTGSFTLTFDPALGQTNQTSGIVMNALNINFAYAPQFTHSPGSDLMAFGGNGVYGIVYGTSDFFFAFWLNGRTDNQFHYTQAGINNSWHSYNVAVTISAPAVTPIPGSVIMMLTALGGLGGVGFMRRREAAPA